MQPKKLRILLVEDEPELLSLLKEKVESYGFNVLCAESNNEAFEKLRNEKFAVIVLDLGLKATSGLRVVDAIRGKPNALNCDTPIIVNSGTIEPSVITKYKNQINEFLAKPVEYKLFKEKIQYWSQKRIDEKIEKIGLKKSG